MAALPSERRKEAARDIPLEYLLIETDSPYLTPPPNRGKRNEPANVIYVAEEIARLKGLTVEKVIQETGKNGICAAGQDGEETGGQPQGVAA